MNYLNCLKHSLFTPETYHRRFDYDLGDEGISSATSLQEGSISDFIKRVALSTLPFIALYRPAGLALSVGMGSSRAISHVAAGLYLQNWDQKGQQFALGVFAVISVASSVFNFSVGLAFATLVDTAQGLLKSGAHAWEGQYQKGFEELLQTLSSGLYLGFMATGVLEIILLSAVMQGLLCLYQARQEIDAGHYLEAGAKVLLAGVKGHQVNHYIQMIQRRDFLFSLAKYQELVARAQNGKQVRHLVEHELTDLQGKIDERNVTLSNQDRDYDFGSHFHGFGKGLVKGCNLAFRTVVVEGKEFTELEFKVNHVTRRHLQKSLESLGSLKGKEVKEILALTGSHAKHLSVDKKGSIIGFFCEGGKDPILQANLEGLGSISVGASSSVLGCGEVQVPNLYDKVVVRMEPDKTIFDFHELMAFLDLDSALRVSSTEDIERLKLGHLFRTFFPREALPLERSEQFFNLSNHELKQEMVARAPQMQEIYDTYFDRMIPSEIIPGRIRYRIEGLADRLKAEGMHSLTTMVTGPQDDQTLFSRVASMLSMGMISTEMRDVYQVNASGLSKMKDYSAGGADNVYLQLMPAVFESEQIPLKDFSWYEGRVRLQVSLKALEKGTYQYARCGLGNREVDNCDTYKENAQYPTRLSILEFVKQINELIYTQWDAFNSHEIMVKDRLPPEDIEGIWVSDEKTRTDLMAYLRFCGLIKNETLLGSPVDQFVRVKSF